MSIETGSVWRNKTHKSWTVKVISVSPSADFMQYATVTGDRVVSTCDTSWFLDHYELHDMVNHPLHYKDASGIECIEVTKYMKFCGGNCFKYLYRCGKKHNDIEDLKKAAWYASRAAKNDRIVSDDDYASHIRAIASHRSEAIKNAMLAVKDGYWWMAEQFINAEIARLESE